MRWTPLLLALAACEPPPLTLPDVTAVFDPAGEGFFDTPFPADARRTLEGGGDWSGFPRPRGAVQNTFDVFLQRATEREGFGFNTPVYLRFDGPVDEALLPSPEGSLEPDAPVQLVDVTPGSPTYGARVPIRWEVRHEEGRYVVPNLLAAAPWPGFPLRPRTTYALVVTTDLAAPAPAFLDVWDAAAPAGAWGPGLAALRAALPDLGLLPEQVAVATTFTTGDPTAQLERIARFVQERVAPPAFRPALELVDHVEGAFKVYRTDYTTPIFMEGDKPYAYEGGAFRFRADGLPIVQRWEPMRMSVVVPEHLADPPPGGWPVVVFVDGTGSTYRSWANSSSGFEPATWITAHGMIGVGIDLPLHGARSTPDTVLDLHSFNVLQPDSALHVHRQAAADVLYLLEGLGAGQVTFTTPQGEPIRLDPRRIAYAGHSQGGITGALALPWMGQRVRGAMLSGAGGLLVISAVERKQTIDFADMITRLLGFEDDEVLTELHPVLGLIQHLVEPTDPINYGRYWLHERGALSGQAPTPVLLTTGLEDGYTPTRTAEAMASAAFLPFAGARFTNDPGMDLRGLGVPHPLPTWDNVPAWDGRLLTAGLSQWEEQGHFPIFRDEHARDLTRNFVISALNGAPVLRQGDAPALLRELP